MSAVLTEIVESIQAKIDEKNLALSAKGEQKTVLESEIAIITEDIGELTEAKAAIEDLIEVDDGEGGGGEGG